MNVKIGYVPYLNMAPFHQGFGPAPFEKDGFRFEFIPLSPRSLGLEAEKGTIDAGAMSLVDYLKLSKTFEPVGPYGIGLRNDAQSVLLFSKKPLAEFSGMCAVTDETSTSIRLLQVLLEARYGRQGVQYGRIPSVMLFDGEADALLLIGDDALKAKRDGVKGFPLVTDLGREWQDWQNLPFVFARWVVRRDLDPQAKVIIKQFIEKSLESTIVGTLDEQKYWDGFVYKFTPEHEKSIDKFSRLLEQICLTK